MTADIYEFEVQAITGDMVRLGSYENHEFVAGKQLSIPMPVSSKCDFGYFVVSNNDNLAQEYDAIYVKETSIEAIMRRCLYDFDWEEHAEDVSEESNRVWKDVFLDRTLH